MDRLPWLEGRAVDQRRNQLQKQPQWNVTHGPGAMRIVIMCASGFMEEQKELEPEQGQECEPEQEQE